MSYEEEGARRLEDAPPAKRHRGGGVGWREVKTSGGLFGGLGVEAKVIGG